MIGHVITAMVTPFAPGGEVALHEAARLAKHLASHESDGIVVGGTTGEAPTLEKREKLELCAAVAGAVAGGTGVILGAGTNDTSSSVELARQAASCGATGIMLVTPYYNKPPQEGLYRHFAAVAQATSLPVMLYNVPGRTGVNLLPATVARLSADHDNIKAVKEASGNLEQVAELCRLTAGRLDVYSGDDGLTLPMLAVGAVGVVSVASHLVGPRLKRMILAFLEGDHVRARKIHLELLPLFRALFVATNPVPVKTALNWLGFDTARFRLPLCPMGQESHDVLRSAMVAAGLL